MNRKIKRIFYLIFMIVCTFIFGIKINAQGLNYFDQHLLKLGQESPVTNYTIDMLKSINSEDNLDIDLSTNVDSKTYLFQTQEGTSDEYRILNNREFYSTTWQELEGKYHIIPLQDALPYLVKANKVHFNLKNYDKIDRVEEIKYLIELFNETSVGKQVLAKTIFKSSDINDLIFIKQELGLKNELLLLLAPLHNNSNWENDRIFELLSLRGISPSLDISDVFSNDEAKLIKKYFTNKTLGFSLTNNVRQLDPVFDFVINNFNLFKNIDIVGTHRDFSTKLINDGLKYIDYKCSNKDEIKPFVKQMRNKFLKFKINNSYVNFKNTHNFINWKKSLDSDLRKKELSYAKVYINRLHVSRQRKVSIYNSISRHSSFLNWNGFKSFILRIKR